MRFRGANATWADQPLPGRGSSAVRLAFAGEHQLVVAHADGTVVRWDETLRSPVLPDLASVVQAPIFRAVFQADLIRLKRLVETGSADGPESPLVRLLVA